eukprot:TRINITY_DN8374_c0_g1_i6.p2 TRINITY_DN8374_c0_g1~~TRINITY_DN8374_c0_g1_i6.p2  ORF type:complete len:113 (+),score=9.15 TRINITY_DN8374_c0_g1_i6:25-363(+)
MTRFGGFDADNGAQFIRLDVTVYFSVGFLIGFKSWFVGSKFRVYELQINIVKVVRDGRILIELQKGEFLQFELCMVLVFFDLSGFWIVWYFDLCIWQDLDVSGFQKYEILNI